MRIIATGTGEALKLTPDRRSRLKEYLMDEHNRARNGRAGLENTWRHAIRAYQAEALDQPDRRWRPFTGAPRIEIGLVGQLCDTVQSQVEDLIFQVKPPLTIRSRKDEYDEAAAAIQDYVDHGVESGRWNFEPAIKRGAIDWAQLGTVIWYVPFTKTVRVTDARKVITLGARISLVAPENFYLPKTADKDIQQASFCTLRTFMSKKQLALRARLNKWAIDDAAGMPDSDLVGHDRRAAAGLSSGGASKPPVTVARTWCYFDLDGDGMEADIIVTWNMLTGGIMKAEYDTYDYRPFVLQNYQDRAHSYAGVGVAEQVMQYQNAATEIINNHIWNMMIANTKAYTGPSEAMQEVQEIYPGAYIPNDSGKEVKPLDLGVVNASSVQAVQIILTMAKERVGTAQLSAPVRSASRTPGISMLSMLQQANRRFTHPFNNLRDGAAECVMQCLYREQEEVRAGNAELIAKIKAVMGDEKADLIIGLMRKSEVELFDALDVELVVSSVSINRESDRQNLVMLATQVVPLYWNVKKELAQFISAPPFPGAAEAAKEADKVFDKLFTKIIKTFDQVSDARAFMIPLENIEQDAGHFDQMLNQLRGGEGAPEPGGNAAPAAPPVMQ